MKILKIEILINQPGTDRVFITTSLPSPFPKGYSNDTLIMSFDVEKNKGIEYINEHFKDIPTIITNTETGEKNVLC